MELSSIAVSSSANCSCSAEGEGSSVVVVSSPWQPTGAEVWSGEALAPACPDGLHHGTISLARSLCQHPQAGQQDCHGQAQCNANVPGLECSQGQTAHLLGGRALREAGSRQSAPPTCRPHPPAGCADAGQPGREHRGQSAHCPPGPPPPDGQSGPAQRATGQTRTCEGRGGGEGGGEGGGADALVLGQQLCCLSGMVADSAEELEQTTQLL